jgi:uncharacterized membrane protein HdeD (DUF308 family)
MESEQEYLENLANKSSGVLTILGFAMVFFGVLSMMAPLMTGIAIALMVGILVLAAGVSQLVCAFKSRSVGRGVLGFLTVVAGMFLLGNPLFPLGFLTLLLIGYFFAQGIVEVMHSFQMRPAQGWGWSLIGGSVSILLALMIWRQWPLSGAWAIGLLVGIRLMFSGFAVIAMAGAARSVAGQATPSQG